MLYFVFVELRGTTRSGGNASELTFESISNDLDAVRRAFGFESVSVLGHSIHGLFAAHYAKRHPGAVDHVVMIGSPAIFPDTSVEPFWESDASPARKAVDVEQQASVSAEALKSRWTSRDAFVEASKALRARTWYDATFDDGPLWADTPMAMGVPQRIFGDLAPGWDAAAELADLSVPTLAALGRYDYRVPYTSWSAVVAKAPGVKVKVFSQSGHYCHFEEPDAFAAELLPFLATADQ